MFQFHKGSIRTGVDAFVDTFYDSFNSIKVQLEQRIAYGTFEGVQFQFHKGSIRTLNGSGCANTTLTFQFHKGSIRTR